MTRRYQARTDDNQSQIVDTLRAAGALVLPLHTVGHGVPDLLTCYRGVLRLLELKTEGGTLTDDQVAFIGLGWPVAVVRTPEEALETIGAI